MCFVCFYVHQRLEFRGVGELHLDNPIAKGIFVQKLWRVFESLVDFNDCAAYGRDEVACCLDALNGAKLFACCNFVVHIGHIDINHIAERVLGIVRDTYITVFAFNANILV